MRTIIKMQIIIILIITIIIMMIIIIMIIIIREMIIMIIFTKLAAPKVAGRVRSRASKPLSFLG